MNIRPPLQDSLIASLGSCPVATIEQLAPDIADPAINSALREQAQALEQLLNDNNQRIESRKALNASIGKTRRAGGDIAPIIEEARQLTSVIDKNNTAIELLVSRITDQCAIPDVASNDLSASNDRLTSHAYPVQPGTNSSDKALLARQRPGQFIPYPVSTDINVNDVSIRDDIDANVWNAYVANNPNATHYHQHAWRDLLIRNFRQRTHYLAACTASGSVVGVTTAVHMESMVVGSSMLSTPFLIYGGPIVDTPAISTLMADHLYEVAQQGSCKQIQLRETHTRDGWQCDMNKVSMVLALPSDLQTLNKRFGSKLRSQVKRATREQPTITIGGADLVPDFYKVFSRKMRDHGTPVYARRFFEDIVETFPDSTRVVVVHLNGKPAAAALLINYRDTIEVPWAASHRRYDRLGINMFMYHQLLEHAVDNGFDYFDFGRSTLDSETWRFKRQWGATEQQLYWHSRPMNMESSTVHTATGNSSEDEMSKDSATDEESTGLAMRLAVGAWKHLPVPVANALGPILARQLPW
ncbi:MAG: GNAT family N-acetyltransferase [Granulosicoccus sp.]